MAMVVVDGIDALERSLGRLFVVVGVFDGLHLGHEYLLSELVREARLVGARPAVVTFDHHPDEILTGHAPPLLCDPEERLERLGAAAVAVTIVQTFDIALRETPYDGFVRRIAERVDLAGFLMTPDSAFGYKRGGTVATLGELGHALDFEVVVVPPFALDGLPVSSSTIRAAIATADFAAAERMLGRPYAVTGDGFETGDGHVAVQFRMPVALPPEGLYDSTVEFRSPAPTQIASASVSEGGQLTLDTRPFSGRARVVFERDRVAAP